MKNVIQFPKIYKTPLKIYKRFPADIDAAYEKVLAIKAQRGVAEMRRYKPLLLEDSNSENFEELV